MPLLFSSFNECLGFSHITKSTSFRTVIALLFMSSRFPMGVATMYKLLFRLLSLVLSLFIIYSCTPQIITNESIFIKKNEEKELKKAGQKELEVELEIVDQKEVDVNQIAVDSIYTNKHNDKKIISEIEIILPSDNNLKITQNFINALELSIYKKNVKNLSLNINTYSSKEHLHEIISTRIQPGKIFIGPLTSNDTKELNSFCSSGVIFFSFAFERQLASDCVYLINFFPEDDLQALFNYFDSNARIALLYPENPYGYYINDIIDITSINSNAIIINKVSYHQDISNAREAIKQLGKYELRRQELERQKKILQNKTDDISKKALKKIEKFETIGALDFTHVIIADHNIRLLEIVPLLPFYDIDPNKIQFVGTGVWDDDAFFDEPSLQGAIFPGISKEKRRTFINEYINAYYSEPIRTSTIMYDLVGLLSYIIENKLDLESIFTLLNDQQLSFQGIDGKFSFENNLIKRDLNILQIKDGKALLIK